MSTILRALHKSERERHGHILGALGLPAQPEPLPRRRLWPWVIVGVLAANAAVLAGALWYPRGDDGRNAGGGPAPVAQVPAAPASPPAASGADAGPTAANSAEAAASAAKAGPPEPAHPLGEAQPLGEARLAAASGADAGPGRSAPSPPPLAEGGAASEAQRPRPEAPAAVATAAPAESQVAVARPARTAAALPAKPDREAAEEGPSQGEAGGAPRAAPRVGVVAEELPPALGPPADTDDGAAPDEEAGGVAATPRRTVPPELAAEPDGENGASGPERAEDESSSPAPLAETRPRSDVVAALRAMRPAEPEPGEKEEADEPSEAFPRLWQLPASVRSSVPKLTMTVHVYSPDEQSRFVKINRRVYREGDRIDEALALDAIAPEGIVLNYKGTRFWVDRQ